MRELTFKGFLTQYVRKLSDAGTCGIYQLAREAATTNPRLREPLFLYALFTGKEQVLLRATKLDRLKDEYGLMLEQHDTHSMLQALADECPSLSNEYLKVYRSYLSLKNRPKTVERVKGQMRDRIMQLQRDKRVSTYRIYTDLRLNSGNVNAFMKHGDCNKVSPQVERRVLEYLEAAM